MTYLPISALAQDTFDGSVITSPKDLQIYFSPTISDGLSSFRVKSTLAGSGTLTVDNSSEWNLNTTANGTDAVTLNSVERCKAYPGQQYEVGWSIRTPDTFSGNQYAEWGIGDGTTGVGFGIDATGLYVWVLKGASYTKVYQSSWNADTADGAGASGLDIDLATPTRFTIEASSIFLGLINFNVILWDADNRLRKITVHRWTPASGAVNSPLSAPLYCKLANGGTATGRDLFAHEFWFSTVGTLIRPNSRSLAQFRTGGTPGSTPLPTVSLRKKSGFEKAKVYVAGFDIATSDTLIVYIRQNPTLTSPSWGTPNVTLAAETSLEQDIVATGDSGGGSNRFSGLFGVGNHAFSLLDLPRIWLKDNEPTSLYVRTISGTASAVHTLLRVVEEW